MGRYAAAIVVLIVMGASPLYAQDAVFVVTTTSADIHKAPSTGSAVIGKAMRGRTFEVRRELGSWVSVSWPEADLGVAYLHVAWGKLSHGTAGQPSAAVAATEAPRAMPPAQPVTTAALESVALPAEAPVAQSPRTSPLPPRALSLPSHVIGLGARIGPREMGIAATGRAWAYGSLGLQLEAGQSIYPSLTTSGRVRSMQLAPSIVFSPPDLVTNAVWARPYLGGGINFNRLTLSSPLDGINVVEHVVGSHIVGGAEFTSASVPQFAVSADVRRQWAPTRLSDFDLDGAGVTLSAHWYLK